jgi:hypothetical protein
VHVDISWSLMTLQQRNGRIDRYGQPRQPLIRYLLNASRSEGMGDAEKVVRLLREKDKQAQLNIGDPAVFLGVYDAAAEVAVRFAGTGLKVMAVEPFEAVATRLQLGSRDLANISGEKPPAHLSSQLRFAVEQANTYLRDCGEQWTARVQPELEAQRERLRRLRGRQEKQKAIDGRFLDHERFVSEVMTIDPAPYLKLVAVLHRGA